jgi:hypothetical protein
MTEHEALYEIMRVASYLPRHSEVRTVIEDAASKALRGSSEETTP